MNKVSFLGRGRLLAALAVTVLFGLLSRLRPVGWYPYDKSLGDVLYAAAVYLVLALAGLRASWAAPLALGLCLAVELFQLTGVPGRFDHILILRWLLGTTFTWHDVGCYVVGVGLIASLDLWLLRPVRARQ